MAATVAMPTPRMAAALSRVVPDADLLQVRWLVVCAKPCCCSSSEHELRACMGRQGTGSSALADKSSASLPLAGHLGNLRGGRNHFCGPGNRQGGRGRSGAAPVPDGERGQRADPGVQARLSTARCARCGRSFVSRAQHRTQAASTLGRPPAGPAACHARFLLCASPCNSITPSVQPCSRSGAHQRRRRACGQHDAATVAGAGAAAAGRCQQGQGAGGPANAPCCGAQRNRGAPVRRSQGSQPAV